MEIAFVGDSITEGIHGVSFVHMLENRYPDYQIDNYGKGGDTVKSLYKRIKQIEHLKEYDLIVLCIGVNDILSKVSWFYRFITTIKEQSSAKNINEFANYYKKIIDYLVTLKTKLIVMPPLFIGEDIHNKWNILLDEEVKHIEHILKEYKTLAYINSRKLFKNHLKGKEISSYIPLSAMEMKADGDDLKKGVDPDEISAKRGLYTSIDGVHLNSVGAGIIADAIEVYLDQHKKLPKINIQ